MNSAEKTHQEPTSKISYQEVCFFIALVMFPLFSYWVYQSDEPFSLFDGISMWPTEFLRMLAAWLSVYLLCRAWDKMNEGRRKIEKAFELTDVSAGGKNDIRFIWSRYRAGGALKVRIKRISPVAVAWLGMCGLLYFVQKPNIPFRGVDVFWADQLFNLLTFCGFVVLFAFVSDATMHCRGFIQKFINEDTVSWPSMPDYSKGIVHDIKREWFEINLIGMRTDDISRTIYYPIYIILLLLAAQSDYFDNFDMPVSLLLIASLNIFLILVFSISLRRKAMEAREKSLDNLRGIEEKVLREKVKEEREIQLAKLRFYEKRILEIRKGAFLPITEQPWLRALTLMGGGGSSLLLLQLLSS